jgi:hypothetical protein
MAGGIVNNRFRHGKTHFEAAPGIPLSPTTSGMRFEKAVLDPETGPETILILTDATPFAYDLARRRPFELRLTSGAVRTSFGPVLFLFWYIPPVTNGKPFALYEHILNPTHTGTLAGLQQAAEQSHLHLVLVGPGSGLLDVYEFENVFDIGNLVPICEWACREYPEMDFTAANHEYNNTYDMMELFHEGLSRA